MSIGLRRVTVLGFAWLLVMLGPTGDAKADVQVTNADIKAVQEKVRMAQSSFQQTWKNIFASSGQNVAAPRVVAFENATMTGCGMVKKDNGYYCDADKTIYLDAEFLAGEMKSTAKALGTDGDYAPIVIAAHEYGHAIAHQLRITYPNEKSRQEFAGEQAADCFAGVITHLEKRMKHLEPDDFEEGLYSIAMAGDDRVNGVDMESLDWHNTIKYLINGPNSHGYARDRADAFVAGYFGGMGACSGSLGGAKMAPAIRTISGMATGALTRLAGGNCTITTVSGGLRVKDASYSDTYCMMPEFSSTATPLPADFRIEVDTTLFVPPNYNPAQTPATTGGIYFTDGRLTKDPKRMGFYVNTYENYQLIDMDNGTQLPGGLVNVFYVPISPIGKVNRMSLEVHRQRGNVYLLAYENNELAQVIVINGESGQGTDSIGLMASHATDGVVFQNFRVVALGE